MPNNGNTADTVNCGGSSDSSGGFEITWNCIQTDCCDGDLGATIQAASSNGSGGVILTPPSNSGENPCCPGVEIPLTLTLTFTAPNCGSSSPYPPISVACCPGVPVPAILYVTVTDTGGCACLDGYTQTIQYSSLNPDGTPCAGSGAYWNTCPGDIVYPPCSDNEIRIILSCNTDLGNVFQLGIGCPAGTQSGFSSFGSSPTSLTCDPFQLVFDLTAFQGAGPTVCCPGTIHVVITE